MSDQETEKTPLPKKRRKRIWRFVLPGVLVFLLGSFIALFYSFNYFGERFLRKYLQDKIRISSKGLYHVDFKTIQVNILTGKIALHGFVLTPDTVRYQQLKLQGKMARSLYRISFASLVIDKVHFRQIYARKRINFRQLIVQYPIISIVGYPDTLTAKRNKWRVIYEDVYPAVSGVFNDFHIDSVKINHGLFETSSMKKNGIEITGGYLFSTVLKDVSVNPFSYYNRDRVFYSRDIDLVVHNFEHQLADSLYSLTAEEIGFSLTKSILYGKKVSLQPNFKSKKIKQVQSGDLFRIELPAFSISGIDLYGAMTDRKVEVSSVSLTDFFVGVYRNKPPPGTVIHKKSRKKITLEGLYTVFAKELRFIAIDSLSLKNGSFEFYGNIADKRPEIRVGTVNLDLSRFRLDSIAHLDQSAIFYSRALELDLARFTLFLRDGVHCINAAAITISTSKSLIRVEDASIFPDRKKNLLLSDRSRNTMFVNLPRLTFTGIDLKKVFNRRILDFDRLIIEEPEVMYTRFRQSKNPDPRFKKAEDFFESENEGVVYNLLKKYLVAIKGNEINLAQGNIKFSVDRNGTDIPLATSSFDLTMQQFLIDSVHGMNEQGYFYSRDFDLSLQSVSVVSPDNQRLLKVEYLHVATIDSLIEARKIHVVKSAEPLIFNSRVKRRQSQALEFTLDQLRLTGLNHKKLFLEKILKANQIILDHPSVSVKTGSSLRPAGPPEEAQLLKTDKFVHTFEIGRCLVRRGAFSYDGEEDRKASYFSLKDIEFALVDANIHIPEPGIHEGLIKFDSLRLRVFPLRAVIADSNYALEARSLEVNSYPANITLKGIKVTPLKSWNEIPGRKSMASVTIPEIRFSGFYFDRAIFDNKWILDSLYVDHPVVSAEIRQEEASAKKTEPANPESLMKLPNFMQSVKVGKVSISHAQTSLILHQANKTRSWSMADIMLEVTRFRVDSATRSNPLAAPLFNCDDITFSAPGYTWVSSDSMYTFAVGRFGISTRLKSAFFDSVWVTPNYNRFDFSRKKGFQTDRLDLKIPRITISGIDLRMLLRNRQLHASNVTLKGVRFESYLDKRIPFASWHRPPMPAQMVANIKFPVCIDTIALSEGFALYEEQTGEEPGRIFFDQMNATLTGLHSPSYSAANGNNLDLHGSLRLMGQAPAEAWFHFQTDHPRDTFSMRANIGKFNLAAINPMLSKLEPASITQGTATATEIVQLNANKISATGKIEFRYTNLALKLHPTKPGTWNRIEQWLLTEAANLFLADNNPNEDGKMKTGIIYYERDPSRGFFNFVWKSVLTGIKSSVGINTKTQKEIKKQEKKRKK